MKNSIAIQTGRASRILLALSIVAAALTGPQTIRGDIVELTFSGSYNTDGEIVFGENGPAVPFEYSLTYDTALDTNNEFYDVGDLLGTETTTHQWYGYSGSGIIDAELTFGNKTFLASDVSPRIPAIGVSADLWFDADISTGVTPKLAWVFFWDADGYLQLGEGTSDGVNIYMQSSSSIDDTNTGATGYTDSMSISMIPEPSMASLFGAVLIGITCFGRQRRNSMPNRGCS